MLKNKYNIKILVSSIIICVLVSLIILILLLKYNDDKNELKTKENDYETNEIYGKWSKYFSEFYVDDELVDTQNGYTETYITIEEDGVKFCYNNEDLEPVCNDYELLINDNIITLSNVNEEIIYKYELTDDGETLVLVCENGNSYSVGYHRRVK